MTTTITANAPSNRGGLRPVDLEMLLTGVPAAVN